MNVRDVDGNGSADAERLRRLRLSEFLRDLVRQEGKMEAAELLGVNHKTLTRAEESGEITGRMGDALELLLRRADDAEVARLRGGGRCAGGAGGGAGGRHGDASCGRCGRRG